jgi:hypothetical protein
MGDEKSQTAILRSAGTSRGTQIYVNLEIDAIWVTDRAVWSQLAKTAFKDVRYLAVNDDLWNIKEQYRPLAFRGISKGTIIMQLQAKELLIVSNNTATVMGATDAFAFIEPKSPAQEISTIRHMRTASTWGEQASKDEAMLDKSRYSAISLWARGMMQPLHC